MTLAQVELTPRLMRLFYSSGLLEKKDWEGYTERNRKQKSIIDVLTQDVTRVTFKDLLNAEVTFKSNRGKTTKERSGLHEGLISGGIINDAELEQLLTMHRPETTSLVEPLRRDGVIGEAELQRFEVAEKNGELSHEKLVANQAVTG